MTEDENLALKYHIHTYKAEDNPQMRKLMIEKGWISERQEVREFLKHGYEEFELNVARRIMKEAPEKVFLNICPKCYKLARTPYARQCRHCGHSWHDLIVAQFKLESSFQISGRHFFLLGQITKGVIKQGQFMDLTMLGLNKRPKIETIEFALKRKDGKAWEDIGLGTNDLSEQDKEYLKDKGLLGTTFDVIKER
jgi:ribosomal protein L40E